MYIYTFSLMSPNFVTCIHTHFHWHPLTLLHAYTHFHWHPLTLLHAYTHFHWHPPTLLHAYTHTFIDIPQLCYMHTHTLSLTSPNFVTCIHTHFHWHPPTLLHASPPNFYRAGFALFLQDMLSLALPCILIIFLKVVSFSKFPMHC